MTWLNKTICNNLFWCKQILNSGAPERIAEPSRAWLLGFVQTCWPGEATAFSKAGRPFCRRREQSACGRAEGPRRVAHCSSIGASRRRHLPRLPARLLPQWRQTEESRGPPPHTHDGRNHARRSRSDGDTSPPVHEADPVRQPRVVLRCSSDPATQNLRRIRYKSPTPQP